MKSKIVLKQATAVFTASVMFTQAAVATPGMLAAVSHNEAIGGGKAASSN
jgi:hypothetical protein